MIGVGLVILHFFGWFWNLVVTAALVQLHGLACSACDADVTVFHTVLEVMLALRISLSSIVSTTGSGVVDGAA